MSSKKTTNYKLHSWEPGDDFMRAEFNQNFSKLDEAIHLTEQKTLQIFTGRYSGLYEVGDATPVRIALQVKPRFVVVVSDANSATVAMQTPENQLSDGITLDASGFTVRNVWGKSIYLHQNGNTYTYVVLY